MSLDDHIEKIFEEAGLSEDDRSLWLSRFENAPERIRVVFVSTFRDDPDLLRFFTNDLRARVAAGNDQDKLKAVLESEREYFRSMLASTKNE